MEARLMEHPDHRPAKRSLHQKDTEPPVFPTYTYQSGSYKSLHTGEFRLGYLRYQKGFRSSIRKQQESTSHLSHLRL